MLVQLNPMKYSAETKAAIIRWAYLIIIIAASVTMIFLLKENREIVADIQQDRKRVLYDNCLNQNSRHRELIQFLNAENAETETAVKFVNLLAPTRNCEQVVINTFGSPIEK